MKQKLISICIPTYNRPQELKRLLESIDTTKYDDVDIVISENCSPKQAETREMVKQFEKTHPYEIHYYENEKNLGYDKNIRALVQRATGKFCVFFSDDDMFMPKALDEFIEFIRAHQECGFILRSYRNYAENGIDYQDFRYYSSDRVFPAGEDTAVELFDKSCFLSGLTFRQEYAKQYVTDAIDGTLLYQLYLLLEICTRYPSAYSRIIISKAVVVQGGVHYFGESESEKGFQTGLMRGSNSLSFIRQYFAVFDFVESHFNKKMADKLRTNFSKYTSYPALSRRLRYCQDKEANKQFFKELEEIGMNCSAYYYVYKIALLTLGVNTCSKIILTLKRIIGHRPKL